MDKLLNESGTPAADDRLRGRMRVNADGYKRRYIVPTSRQSGSRRNYSSGEQPENPTGSSHSAAEPQAQKKS